MSPKGKTGPSAEDSRRTKALDRAVQKLEAMEAKKGVEPVRSIGRAIRDGWRENA